MTAQVKIKEPTADAIVVPEILRSAAARGRAAGLLYAGGVSPEDAWRLFSNGQAHLVDVRATEERRFVGHVPHSLHAAWQTGLNLVKNPHFLRELENLLPKDAAIIMLCRSGNRSAAAATGATAAGFKYVFNVREGFEGDLDVHNQRGTIGGWRQRGLPWIQD
jgi:rhodanese-related sulfurtransferase